MLKRLVMLTAAVTMLAAIPVYAGQWTFDSNGYRYQNDDGNDARNEWVWIDMDGDGASECYYFGEDGYRLTDTATPDGYVVDNWGMWVVDGVRQTRGTSTLTGQSIELQMSQEEADRMRADLKKTLDYYNGIMPTSDAAPEPVESDPFELADRVLELVNEERVKHGREALEANDDLMDAAVMRAEESDYCAPHTRPDGSSFGTAISYSKYAGENLMNMSYATRGLEQLAQDATQGWMNSSGHRQNILNSKFKETGVGVFIEGSRMCIIQLFAD